MTKTSFKEIFYFKRYYLLFIRISESRLPISKHSLLSMFNFVLHKTMLVNLSTNRPTKKKIFFFNKTLGQKIRNKKDI